MGLAVLTLVLGLMVGLGSNSHSVHGQDAGGSCVVDEDSILIQCSRVGDDWGSDHLVWNIIDVKPVGAPPRRLPLEWRDVSGTQWQPIQYTAYWGTTSETVTINSDGEDASPSGHPNIRYNRFNGVGGSKTVVHCDSYNASGGPGTLDRIRIPGSSGNCIGGFTYRFDVRDKYNGQFEKCYTKSTVRAHSQNSNLSPRNVGACETATSYAWVTQRTTTIPCGYSSYDVRYN